MSALPPKADIGTQLRDVRFVVQKLQQLFYASRHLLVKQRTSGPIADTTGWHLRIDHHP